jgi:hypothetical protein
MYLLDFSRALYHLPRAGVALLALRVPAARITCETFDNLFRRKLP